MFNAGTVIEEYDISDLIRQKLLLHRQPEISFVQKSIFECLNFLISNNKIKLSRAFNNGYVRRAGQLKSGNSVDGFMPIAKALAGNCGNVYSESEAIWFSKEALTRYLGLNDENPYGLLSCRQLKNIDSRDNSLLAFINLSTKRIPPCSRVNGHEAVLLSKSIQEHFNKCSIHYIVRRYCTQVQGPRFDGPFLYNDIIGEQNNIVIDLNVLGYQCDPKYVGIPGMPTRTTLKDVLDSWNYQTGTRLSVYKPDRIQIDAFFVILDIMNEILNISGAPIILDSHKVLYPDLSCIKILGWTCEDTPRERDCSLFPAEIAIAIKYLKKPVRYGIFEKQSEACKPQFFRKDVFGNIMEINKDDRNMRQYMVGYNIGGKKELNTENSDSLLLNNTKNIDLELYNSKIRGYEGMPKISDSNLLDSTKKNNKLQKLSDIELEINQLFVTSPKEEKLYTSEDKKISDFFSNIIEKEKFEIEKEEEYIGGKKYKLISKKRSISKSKKRSISKSKKRSISKSKKRSISKSKKRSISKSKNIFYKIIKSPE
jgi:hypothetical protein